MCVCPHFISICADAPSASLIGGEATLLHWAYMDQLTLPLQQHPEHTLIPAVKYEPKNYLLNLEV